MWWIGSVLVILGVPVATPGQQAGGVGKEVLTGSANAILGGITAGVFAWLGGKDISDAFFAGSGGGLLSYGGKRIATASFDGAGFLGREVSSVGHSVITNAGNGRQPFSQIWFPLGPIQFRPPGDGHNLGVQVDVMSATLLLFGILSPDLDLQWGATLAEGTPVFLADRDIHFGGEDFDALTTSGFIILSDDLGNGRRRRTALRHEMIHVIQNDMMRLTWSYPLEQAVSGGRLDEGSFFQFGISSPLFLALLGAEGLFEIEAGFLDGR